MASAKTNPGDIPGRLLEVLGGPVTVDLTAAAVYAMYRNARRTMVTHILFQNFSAYPPGSTPPAAVVSLGTGSATPTELYNGGGAVSAEVLYGGPGPAFTGNFVAHPPIIPGSLTIETTIGVQVIQGTDDGAGGFTGPAEIVSGTIDYATGAVDIEFSGDALTAVLVNYSYSAFALDATSPMALPISMVDVSPYVGASQQVYFAVVTGVAAAGTVEVTICGAVLP
jgi:hypothetical protein